MAEAKTNAEGKAEALEQLLIHYFDPKYKADAFADHARHIVDLMGEEMKETERNAAWILIKYAKKRENEFRALEQAQVRAKEK